MAYESEGTRSRDLLRACRMSCFCADLKARTPPSGHFPSLPRRPAGAATRRRRFQDNNWPERNRQRLLVMNWWNRVPFRNAKPPSEDVALERRFFDTGLPATLAMAQTEREGAWALLG